MGKICLVAKATDRTGITHVYLILASGPCNLIKGKVNIATDLHQREEGKIKYKREKDNSGEVGAGFEN